MYSFAGILVENLEDAKQPVPEELLSLALKNPAWKRTRPASTGRGQIIPGAQGSASDGAMGGGAGRGGGGGRGRGRGRGGYRGDDDGGRGGFNAVPPPPELLVQPPPFQGGRGGRFNAFPPPANLMTGVNMSGGASMVADQILRAKQAALEMARRLSASIATSDPSSAVPMPMPATQSSSGAAPATPAIHPSRLALLGKFATPAKPSPPPVPTPSTTATSSGGDDDVDLDAMFADIAGGSSSNSSVLGGGSSGDGGAPATRLSVPRRSRFSDAPPPGVVPTPPVVTPVMEPVVVPPPSNPLNQPHPSRRSRFSDAPPPSMTTTTASTSDLPVAVNKNPPAPYVVDNPYAEPPPRAPRASRFGPRVNANDTPLGARPTPTATSSFSSSSDHNINMSGYGGSTSMFIPSAPSIPVMASTTGSEHIPYVSPYATTTTGNGGNYNAPAAKKTSGKLDAMKAQYQRNFIKSNATLGVPGPTTNEPVAYEMPHALKTFAEQPPKASARDHRPDHKPSHYGGHRTT
jgi:hypothetical protein